MFASRWHVNCIVQAPEDIETMQAQVAELEASSMELHEVPKVGGAALFNGSRCGATSFCVPFAAGSG